jgi:hypothetical protein
VLRERLAAAQQRADAAEAAQLQAAQSDYGWPGVGRETSGAPPPLPCSEAQAAQVFEHLHRLLRSRDERIRQLGRQQDALTSRAAQADAHADRAAEQDAELAQLRAQLRRVREPEAATGAYPDAEAAAGPPPPEAAAGPALPPSTAQLASELAWVRASRGLITHLCRRLRADLACERLARTEAEAGALAAEALYLSDAVDRERALAAAMEQGFDRARRAMVRGAAVVRCRPASLPGRLCARVERR